MSVKNLKDLTCRDPDEVVREGAAIDGAQAEGDLSGWPRVLRYALLPNAVEVGKRVAADVATLAPHLSAMVATWASSLARPDWATLAISLDEASVRLDQPILRALADVVRMHSMMPEDVRAHPSDALRVIASLTAAANEAPDFMVEHVGHLATVDLYVVGWTHLVSGARSDAVLPYMIAHAAALQQGRAATQSLVTHTVRTVEDRYRESPVETAPAPEGSVGDAEADTASSTKRSVVVCPALDATAGRIKDMLKAHVHVVGEALPLTEMPDIADVRRSLVFEYPYAVAEIDRLLSPLVGREYVQIPPTIVVGPPGSGKSRLFRRLSEALGVHCWRTDGTRADGNTFGGTDRRWYSVEPCHAFLAISRARTANPLILVDEVDKAATRTDHGRLWDALLPFLERETASAYPDPALQVDLDLSAVSFVMTANSVADLPPPLVDRCRVIQFPEPTAADTLSLLPALLRDHARDSGLDARWVEPLSADERELVAQHWRGGSVRRLRGIIDAVLRGRERMRAVQ